MLSRDIGPDPVSAPPAPESGPTLEGWVVGSPTSTAALGGDRARAGRPTVTLRRYRKGASWQRAAPEQVERPAVTAERTTPDPVDSPGSLLPQESASCP
jgi:hypothetical protein